MNGRLVEIMMYRRVRIVGLLLTFMCASKTVTALAVNAATPEIWPNIQATEMHGTDGVLSTVVEDRLDVQIVVDLSTEKLYAMGKGADGAYNRTVKAFGFTTFDGADIPLGAFTQNTGPVSRFHYFKDMQCWARYTFAITDEIMMHSDFSSSRDNGAATTLPEYPPHAKNTYNGILLTKEDAQWLYEHCNKGVTVTVKGEQPKQNDFRPLD